MVDGPHKQCTPGPALTVQRPAVDLTISIAFVCASVIWVALCGKDLNWDQLNYHFYVAFSFLNDRLGHDFMAANAQSYLNPLAYVPFYWMVEQGWHSLLIASVLAAFHGLAVVLCYFIVRAAIEHHPHARGIAVCGAVLAFLSPIFLTEVGTSFADISTAVLLLAALVCLLTSDAPKWPGHARVIVAGLLVGASAGLKLSNIVFVPAFGVALLLLRPQLRAILRSGLLFGAASSIGLLATHGYWSRLLSKAFGVDPLSLSAGDPSAEASSILPQRFLPDSVLEALTLPFRMMEIRAWVYIETVAPDLRVAAAVIATLVGAFVWWTRRRKRSIATHEISSTRLASLFAFVLCAAVLWIFTSSNGRYGILVSILCGPAVALLIAQIDARARVLYPVLIGLMALQVVHLSQGQLRWVSEEWTRTWFEASVPSRLVENPFTYISVGGNSSSYIVPFLARDSVFVNPVGQLSIELEGAAGERLKRILDTSSDRLRVISAAKAGEPLEMWTRKVDLAIARLDLGIDTSDCELISTAGPRTPQRSDEGNDEPRRRYLRTCRLFPRPYKHAEERNRVRTIVRSIESWCPKLFGAPGVVEQMQGGWSVAYPSTDNVLNIQGQTILLANMRAISDIYLGTLEDWENGRRPECENMSTNMRKTHGLE